MSITKRERYKLKDTRKSWKSVKKAQKENFKPNFVCSHVKEDKIQKIAFCELVTSSYTDHMKLRPNLNCSTREAEEYSGEKVEYAPFF